MRGISDVAGEALTNVESHRTVGHQSALLLPLHPPPILVRTASVPTLGWRDGEGPCLGRGCATDIDWGPSLRFRLRTTLSSCVSS